METIIKYLDKNSILHEISVNEDKQMYAVNLYLIKEFMCNTEFYYYNAYTQKIDLYAFEYHTIDDTEEEFIVNEHTQEMYLVKDCLLNDNENRVLACCIYIGKLKEKKVWH